VAATVPAPHGTSQGCWYACQSKSRQPSGCVAGCATLQRAKRQSVCQQCALQEEEESAIHHAQASAALPIHTRIQATTPHASTQAHPASHMHACAADGSNVATTDASARPGATPTQHTCSFSAVATLLRLLLLLRLPGTAGRCLVCLSCCCCCARQLTTRCRVSVGAPLAGAARQRSARSGRCGAVPQSAKAPAVCCLPARMLLCCCMAAVCGWAGGATTEWHSSNGVASPGAS
jgi:hypothetical protein